MILTWCRVTVLWRKFRVRSWIRVQWYDKERSIQSRRRGPRLKGCDRGCSCSYATCYRSTASEAIEICTWLYHSGIGAEFNILNISQCIPNIFKTWLDADRWRIAMLALVETSVPGPCLVALPAKKHTKKQRVETLANSSPMFSYCLILSRCASLWFFCFFQCSSSLLGSRKLRNNADLFRSCKAMIKFRSVAPFLRQHRQAQPRRLLQFIMSPRHLRRLSNTVPIPFEAWTCMLSLHIDDWHFTLTLSVIWACQWWLVCTWGVCPAGSWVVRAVMIVFNLQQPWITPSIFENTNNSDIVDEYTFGQMQDPDEALQVLQSHWATWITEDDFQAISAAGLNHVRWL